MTTSIETLIDGQPVVYLLPDATVPQDSRVENYDPHLDALLHGLRHTRRIVMSVTRRGLPLFGVIRWPPGADATGVDERVAAGVAQASDFEQASYAEPRWITCVGCDRRLAALVADFGVPILGDDRDGRIRASGARPSCPFCGAGMQFPILDLLGSASPGPSPAAPAHVG